ncbi:hypothetical protein JOD20_001114 [Herpetosiphon giganteus]|nr:hypothetical protein [Herpetosiphon giganteus]
MRDERNIKRQKSKVKRGIEGYWLLALGARSLAYHAKNRSDSLLPIAHSLIFVSFVDQIQASPRSPTTDPQILCSLRLLI